MKYLSNTRVIHIFSLILFFLILTGQIEEKLEIYSQEINQVSFSPANQSIVDNLEKSNIIYLGEIHGRPGDHQAQLDLVKYLHNKNPKIAIALEIFPCSLQSIINDYLAGEINEQELLDNTEYEKNSIYPWKHYAPLVRFAQANRLDLIAMNTPLEITRQVSQSGLSIINQENLDCIPLAAEVDTSNEAYREILRDFFEAHSGHGNSSGFENFVAAQVLWDETMAKNIAEYHQNHPLTQIIVIVGRAHVINNYGIPNRVARRIEPNNFVQKSVIFVLDETIEEETADFIWQISN